MKRFIALIIMFLPLLAMAQQPDFSKLTKRYANNDKVTIISLTQQQLLLFMGGGDGAEDTVAVEIIQKFPDAGFEIHTVKIHPGVHQFNAVVPDFCIGNAGAEVFNELVLTGMTVQASHTKSLLVGHGEA